MAFQIRLPCFLVRGASCLTFTAAFLLVTPSWASEVFPQHLIETYDWGGNSAECTLCHTASPGTAGTAIKPFAAALKTRALAPRSLPSLDAAIAMLGETDSDSDGFPDFEELTQQGDPNDASIVTGGFTASEPVEYGCVGGTIAGRTASSSGAAVAAAGFVALALLWSRRRRV